MDGLREVEEMREAFERVEKNLERFRWMITHPYELRDVINRLENTFTTGSIPGALIFANMVDNARKES